jgi:hypothetical protein
MSNPVARNVCSVWSLAQAFAACIGAPRNAEGDVGIRSFMNWHANCSINRSDNALNSLLEWRLILMNTTFFKKSIAIAVMGFAALFLVAHPTGFTAHAAPPHSVIDDDPQDKKDRDANRDRGKKEPKSVYREDKKDDRPKNDQRGKKPNDGR